MKASKLETLQVTVEVSSMLVKVGNGLKYLGLRCFEDTNIFRISDFFNHFLLV